MQVNDAFSKLSIQPAATTNGKDPSKAKDEPLTPPQASVAKLPAQPKPNIRQILLNFAACIENKHPGLFDNCKKVNFDKFKIFLIPIPERRNINLFTLAMINFRNDFSEMVLDKLEEANLLSELVRQKDFAGWTPVHHAALLNKKIYKRLKKIPEVAGLKTSLANSPSILRKIVRMSKNCLSDNDYHIYVRMPGKSVDILLPSSEAIQQKELFPDTPIHFTTVSHMSLQTINALWNKSMGAYPCDNTKFNSFNEYLQNLHGIERKLALRMVETDDAGDKPSFKIGIGVFAKTDIKAGTVIGCYAGRVEKNQDVKGPATYRMDYIQGYSADGFFYRSFGSMINHSFPNIEYRSATINGIQETPIIAIQDIKEGEQLCGSYGDSYFNADSSVFELRPKAMEAFVKEHPMKEFLAIKQKISLTPHQKISLTPHEDKILAQWDYLLFDMPVRFLQLILRGVIPLEDAKNLHTIFENELDYQDTDSVFYKYMNQFSRLVDLQALELCIDFMKSNPQRGLEIAKRLICNGCTVEEFEELIEK